MDKIDDIAVMFENIPKFFAARGATGPPQMPNKETLVNDIKINTFFTAKGKIPARNGYPSYNLIAVVIDRGSSSGKNKGDFEKMLRSLGSFSNTNIIIFSENNARKISKFSKIVKDIGEKNEGFFIETHEHEMLMLNPIENGIVPRHTIMNMEEISKLREDTLCDEDKWPEIMMDDPPIVWIGAKPGDLVRVDADSGVSGRTTRYRFVVPDLQ